MHVLPSANYVITNQKVLTRSEDLYLRRMCVRAFRNGELRNPLMILTTRECGLRATETTDLLVRDFSPEAMSIFVRSKKGSNSRELPLKPYRSRQLERWILTHYGKRAYHQLDQDAPIFPVGYHAFRDVWDFYRPAPKKLHSLRHTFAVDLYLRCKDIRAVQIALGHRNISNTMVYADFHYTQNGLRKLMHG